MFDFLSEVRRCFGGLIASFNLNVLSVDDTECLFVGDGFALSIAYDRDGLDVNYIDRSTEGFRVYRITNYLSSQRFVQNDRALYGQPLTGSDRITASMRVYASGLEERCRDILRGDKDWLLTLKNRDPNMWVGFSPTPSVAMLLATV